MLLFRNLFDIINIMYSMTHLFFICNYNIYYQEFKINVEEFSLMEDYGFLTLIPPAIAIFLCLITRRVLISLFLGVFAGSLIISGWNPLEGLIYSLDTLSSSISDTGHVHLLLFNLFMGSGFALMWRLGGSKALSEWAKTRLKSKRGVGIGAWLLGFVVFFSDYISIIIRGSIFRDVFTNARVSKEKLSYMIASTSGPIATFFISDWIAFQISMVKEGIEQAGITDVAPLTGYLQSIPLNIYCIFAVALVGIVAISRKDWGPMLKAERRAEETGEVSKKGSAPMMEMDKELGDVLENVKPRLITFILPLVVLIVVTLFGFYWTGHGDIEFQGSVAQYFVNILEKADAGKALLWGSFCMTLVGMILALVYKAMNLEAIMGTVIDGMKMMILACSILVLAWSVGAVMKDMGLAKFIVQLIGKSIPFPLIPPMLFLIGMLISFATGTSWGTMTILTPIAIPLVYRLTGDSLTAVMMSGVVFSGAIFGDNCSPISDTMVLSTIFSGANHMDHVVTQIPYSVECAAISFVLYFLYGIFNVKQNWTLIVLGIVLGIIALILITFALHRISSKKLDKAVQSA